MCHLRYLHFWILRVVCVRERDMATALSSFRARSRRGSSDSLEEAKHRALDFFRDVCRVLPGIMDRYNPHAVITPSQLRSKISEEFRIHSDVTNRKTVPAVSYMSSRREDDHSKGLGALFKAVALLGAGATGLIGFSGVAYADETEHGLPAPSYPWIHNGILSSYDHSSIRRGHQVYQQVCAACHSMSLIAYRDLIGVAYTEDEVKALSAEAEIEDGPNDEGEMYSRPGKPSDHFPKPYANESAARFANGGAYPPDLSLITKARHNGQNYVFSLLTGYRDPPAGVSIREGLHYNPYFPGGAIAMPQMLSDGGVEYEDKTPATASQMAKDVTTFLAWAAEPEMEERKLMGIKLIFVLSLVFLTAAYYKRWKWSPVKSRRLIVDAIN